ncbi:hypothetical protein F0562_032131 [Nyssa sinensis]|uniref:Uncharacterized protein n=1 Tax=Nyssa sinensis TaxID=561372 RepID=A0A5J5AWG7_9ASTE|nr:hypothetical protein F0562_032131 [Nyssa sinensis]
MMLVATVKNAQAFDTVAVAPTGTSSCDSSRFNPLLPRIKDDSDLVTLIVEYQEAFSKDVIVNLGGEEAFGVPCSCKGFITFHLVLTPTSYRILIGFQAFAYIYKLRLGFTEFRASYIIKRIGTNCYYISLCSAILIQNQPQGEKGWGKCTLKIGGAWQFPPWKSLFVVPQTWYGV